MFAFTAHKELVEELVEEFASFLNSSVYDGIVLYSYSFHYKSVYLLKVTPDIRILGY